MSEPLTRERIESLPAGAELDAMIADRVMGVRVMGVAPCFNHDGAWCVEHPDVLSEDHGGESRPVYQDSEDPWQGSEDPFFRKRMLFGVTVYALKPVPRYSEDIAAAWLVVQRMAERIEPPRRRDLNLSRIEDADGRTEWRCHFCTIWHGIGCGDTPMLAICKAALLAVNAG